MGWSLRGELGEALAHAALRSPRPRRGDRETERETVLEPARSDGSCSISQGSERETWNAGKVLPVPCQQDALVRQGDASDQAVAHAYRLPGLLERPSDLGGSICGDGVEGQARQRLEQLHDQLLLPRRTRTSTELEAGHRGRAELGVLELDRDAICTWTSSLQVVDEHVGVGDHHRQESLISRVAARSRSASRASSAPLSIRARRRLSSSPACDFRYASSACCTSFENPFSPRRAASSIRRARCSGLMSTVVRTWEAY